MVSIKILILAAHHDDETLGCGGTIARLVSEGHDVDVLVLGEGPASREGTDYLEAIRNSKAAIESLGGTLYMIDGPALPDNQFDTETLFTIARRIESMISLAQPQVVYTHHRSDVNRDHRAVYEATLIATRPVPGCVVREAYAYEVPSSTEWAFGGEAFKPNVFQPITPAQLQCKIEAMEMYETERRSCPHPRSPENLRALATVRGSQAGVPLAEAFELVRMVR